MSIEAIVTTRIQDVAIQPLRMIRDERGAVMHMLRKDSPLFEQFGEVYFSTIAPGAIKAWKKQQRATQLFAVPVGNIRIVLYDARLESPTYEKIETVDVGVDNYCLLRIPSGIWYGFKGQDQERESLLVNCTSHPHDPTASEGREVDNPPCASLLSYF